MNDELEVGFDARFEAAWSRVERLGRWAMLAIVALGLLGLLGAGPLDHRSVGLPTGVGIDYQPIGRFGTATQITIHLPADPSGRGVLVRLSSNFFEPLGVREMTPHAVSEKAVGGGIEALFTGDTTRPSLVRLDGKPSRIGAIPLAVDVGAAPPLRVTEYVLP